MDRSSGSQAPSASGRGSVTLLLAIALMLAPMAQAARAQTTATPGSTINGTVPTSEGNVWNGLDHQPTPAEIAPLNNPHRSAKEVHTLNKLNNELLNYPLPKVPAGAPPVNGN